MDRSTTSCGHALQRFPSLPPSRGPMCHESSPDPFSTTPFPSIQIQDMKKTAVFVPLVQTHVSDWLSELREVEAPQPSMIGGRLKFDLPLSPAKPKRRNTGGEVEVVVSYRCVCQKLHTDPTSQTRPHTTPFSRSKSRRRDYFATPCLITSEGVSIPAPTRGASRKTPRRCRGLIERQPGRRPHRPAA